MKCISKSSCRSLEHLFDFPEVTLPFLKVVLRGGIGMEKERTQRLVLFNAWRLSATRGDVPSRSDGGLRNQLPSVIPEPPRQLEARPSVKNYFRPRLV